MKKIICTLAMSMAVLSCSTNPFTGKSPLKLVGNQEIIQTSFAQYQTTLKDAKLSTNVAQTQMVKSVGAKIQKAVEEYAAESGNSDFLKDFQWEYNLIEDKQINAWCMPGGKVAFYTGIMPVCETETGVAVVMGHEITHALAEHGAQRISNQYIAQGVNLAGSIALSKNPKTQSIFSSLYPTASSVTILAYGRKHESEADKIGLEIMARAGFDPREAPKFWSRMEKATSNGAAKQPEFLSTHPHPATRIKDLEALIPQVMPLYEAAIAKR